jgi:hypothetical protein
MHRRRVIVAILSAFAAAALVLSAVALFGVISYSVAQRTREFGARGPARGASRRLTYQRRTLTAAARRMRTAVTGSGPPATRHGDGQAPSRLTPGDHLHSVETIT